MELREEDEDVGRPSPLVYNPHSMGDRRDQATINLSQSQHHVHHHHHQSDLPEQTQRPRRDPSPNPDPDSSRTQIGTGSSLKPQCPSQVQATTSTTTATAAATITTTTTTTAAPSVRYRECLKNHAASMGTHVLDGCGEFMPSGEEGTPEALRCAACDCHRNFHRKEVDGEGPQYVANCYFPHNTNKITSRRDISAIPQLPSPLQVQPPIQQHRYSHNLPTSPPACPVPPIVMNFGGGNAVGAPAEYSSSEELNMYQSPGGTQIPGQPGGTAMKKRFRTKFTPEQKDKMLEFAEKLEWKIQKQDEQEVEQFCSQVGVKRQVFKVWMHNNKQAMKRKQI